MQGAELPRTYDIGPFRLDADVGALTRAGTPVTLGARAAAVLTVLVERVHQFVSKELLLEAAWPGVVVEEGNLPVQIHAIRRVLAQAPGGDRWIETLAKRGYRFVGPVDAVGEVARDDAEVARSNLPQALTTFVGRERDLVELKRLLPSRRLITIVGVGGIGKTRLALQLAGEVIGAYRDGAWLAELGSLRDPALVPTVLAQSLGVQERAEEPVTMTLRAWLRDRQLLLIVDNCEHLLGACATLADALLTGAAQTTIIATSREPLGVAGEQVYALQPLSLPRPGASVEALQRSEAVQLLVERLRQQLPDFALTADRAPAIAELCVHLDGIPLALELAAGRARSLSIEQINARLGNRFRLLTGGSPAALPRQQTLRATLDWSHELLGGDERILLRRLAVFPGSFTADAACGIASDPDIDEFAVIDLLSRLVARSLLIADTSTGAARYRLLETTRAYAYEKLGEAQETEALLRRHAQYFREWFAPAPEDFLRLSDARLREIYVPELDHVRRALDWAFGLSGDATIGIALAAASGPLWGTLGLFAEGARRLEAATATIEPETPLSEQALLWRQLGRLMEETPSRAAPALERAASLYRRIEDRLGLAHTLVQLGRALAYLGKSDAAEAALDEADSLLADVDIPWLRALYFFHRGFLRNRQRDFIGARSCYEQAQALFRRAGDELTAGTAEANVGLTAWALGDLEAAEASFRRHVARIRASALGTRRSLAWSLAHLAGVLIERGRLEEAWAAAREAFPLLLEDGTAWIFVSHLALGAALGGRLDDAARLSGYSDRAFARNQVTTHPVDARTEERLRPLLQHAFAAGELERLRAEGAALSEAEACELALAG